MSEFLSTLVMVVIIWYGGNLIFESQDNPNLSALSSKHLSGSLLFFSILPSVKSPSQGYYPYKKELLAERILSVLDAKIEVQEKDDALTIDTFKQSIRFENAFFLTVRKMYCNINLEIKKGKTIAL